MKNWIKTAALGIAACFVPVVAHAFQPIRYVQVSSTTVLTSQKGGMSVDTATFQGVTASTITVSSFTVTGNASFKGIVTATGAVTLGGAGNSVVISSNAVLPGTTFYAPGSAASIVTDTMTAVSITATNITVTTITPTGIVGTTTNNNAFAGNYSYYISSGPTDSRGAATSGNYSDLASTGVPSGGDWNVTPCIQLSRNGASVTAIRIGISQTSGNSFPEEGLGRSVALTGSVDITDAGTSTIFCGPPQRWSLAAATTLYLKTRSTYTVAIPNIVGLMEIRRAR